MKSIPLRAHEAAAYAAGRLTQIRRVCKFPVYSKFDGAKWRLFTECDVDIVNEFLATKRKHPCQQIKAPYGAPGDTLALREAWAYLTYGDIEDAHYVYRADYKPGTRIYEYPCGCGFCHEDPECGRWKSSTQMRLSAVRWHPVITAVRLEKVQEMSEADARACGIGFTEDGPLHWHTMIGDWWVNRATHKEAAQDLWNHLNPRTPWKDNPWTWVYELEGVKS